MNEERRALQGTGTLLTAVVAALQLFSVAEAAPHGNDRSSRAPVNLEDLFEPRAKVLSVPLAEQRFGLMYQMDDAELANDRAPRPLAYDPELGLVLVNPGDDGPTLQRFDGSGERAFKVPLTEALGLSAPDQFQPQLLSIHQGAILLLFARRLDDDGTGWMGKDFAMAAFDASSGKRLRVTELKQLGRPDLLYFTASGGVWAHRGTGKASEWLAFGADGRMTTRFRGSQGAVVLPSGKLALLGNHEWDGEAAGAGRLFDPGGSSRPLRLHGPLPPGGVHIPGKGDVLARVQVLNVPRPVENLHRLVWSLVKIDESAAEGGCVSAGLGSASHAEFGQGDSPERFEQLDHRWSYLDTDGTLITIVRGGPRSPAITVYRQDLREDVRKRLRELPARR